MTDGVGFALAISVWLTMKIAGHCQWCGVFPSILPPDFAFDPVMSSKKFQKKCNCQQNQNIVNDHMNLFLHFPTPSR